MGLEHLRRLMSSSANSAENLNRHNVRRAILFIGRRDGEPSYYRKLKNNTEARGTRIKDKT